jgi:hippurate hydrolase
VDPVVASAHIITALQTVVSRNVDPLDMGVVTVGSIHGGNAPNVVPESVELKLTARAFKPEVRAVLQERIPAIARAQAESFGATADVLYRPGYPAVLNHEAETELARSVAIDTFGAARVDAGFRPRTASEDFAFMLLKRPGSTCSWAMAMGHRCTARTTTSTTPSWRPRPRTGCGWPSGFWPETLSRESPPHE